MMHRRLPIILMSRGGFCCFFSLISICSGVFSNSLSDACFVRSAPMWFQAMPAITAAVAWALQAHSSPAAFSAVATPN